MKTKGSRTYSNGQLLADIRRLARELGHFPSAREYQLLGKHSSQTMWARFGSWANAIRSAGLNYTPKTGRHRIRTTTELTQDVRRVELIVKRIPTHRDYEEHGRFSVDSFYSRVGATSWEEVLVKLCGYDRETCKALRTYGLLKYKTTKDRIEEVRALARKLGRTPKSIEARKAGINDHELCKRIGGKWGDVLVAARLAQPIVTNDTGAAIVIPVSESVEAIKGFFREKQRRKGGGSDGPDCPTLSP